MDFEFPADFFDPPAERPEWWPDDPDLRRAVDWFRSFMPEAKWPARREAAARRLYETAVGQVKDGDKGRFFSENDVFGWYLFLCEAQLDHIGNYDPMFGSRVVPVFTAIGRNLPLLLDVGGVEDRARRIVNKERKQPNGGLFELLVAAAYRKAGAEVTFIEELKGKAKTPDMEVRLGDKVWAVECKRMETGEYGERERSRMRALWGPSAQWLARQGMSVFCDAGFDIEIDAVPDGYLRDKVRAWLADGQRPLSWRDAIGSGTIATLDLAPLQAVLATDHVLGTSSRILQLLTGEYVRNANHNTILGRKLAPNPRYFDDCDLAVVLRWESRSDAAIGSKARDITKKLADAVEQLPNGIPGIVHIGFEAVDGDAVERARYAKILETTGAFDPMGKPLEYVYCHYLVPESPPDQSWAYDETTQWCAVRPTGPRPLGDVFLVIPPASGTRQGPHWE